MADPLAPKESTGTVDLAKLIGLHRAGPETTLAGMRSLRGGSLERGVAVPAYGVAAAFGALFLLLATSLGLGNARMQRARAATRAAATLAPLRQLVTIQSVAPPAFSSAPVPVAADKPVSRAPARRTVGATAPHAPAAKKSGPDKCGYCKGDISCIISCSAKTKTK